MAKGKIRLGIPIYEGIYHGKKEYYEIRDKYYKNILIHNDSIGNEFKMVLYNYIAFKNYYE